MSTFNTITPEIVVHDGPGGMDFYRQAFRVVEHSRMMSPDGKKVMHGQLEILGHSLEVCDEFLASEGGTCRCPRSLGGTGVRLMLRVEDADRIVALALAAGATVMFPVTDTSRRNPGTE